ncbi:hypothetical protein B0H12DRAFT_1076654 [Mycena haematopus]|nr:hypothetical protein B0H12DRAFT_1076654 [Mycena haematopus]
MAGERGRVNGRSGRSGRRGAEDKKSSAPGRAADPAEKRSRKGGRHDGNVHGRGRARGSSTKGEYCEEVNTAKSRKYGLDANRLGMKPGSEVTGYGKLECELKTKREFE